MNLSWGRCVAAFADCHDRGVVVVAVAVAFDGDADVAVAAVVVVDVAVNLLMA